jgi:hypothetical protein
MSVTAARLRARTPLVVALVLGLLLAPLASVTPAALADSGMEAQAVSQINAERTSRGLPALSTSGDLTSVARSWSATMADQNKLYHNPNLGSQVSGWQKVGENVGRGPSVGAIHSGFMASDGHRKNILDPAYTQVGVGVVVKDGTVWVTQVFRQPAGQSKPAPPKEEPKKEEPKKEEPTKTTSSSSGSSGSSSSGTTSTSSPSTTSSGSSASSAPAPPPPPEPEPEPEPEPHEVTERPLPMDRVTLMLARLEATDLDSDVGTVLAAGA